MTHTRRICLLLAAGLALSLAIQPAEARKKKKKARVESAGDLLIVDCLLPGQVMQLGQVANYIAQRQRIRTSAVDCRIRGGEYAKYDRSSYASSLAFWLPEANAGDPEAQVYVGQLYEKGVAVSPDYALAALWYRKAANQGLAQARVNLANLYEQGLGVDKDPEAARDWYSKAAGMSDNEIQDARRQVEELRKELEALDLKTKDLERQIEEAQSDRQRAEDEARELRQRLEKARESNASGAASAEWVERLEADLERQEGEIERRAEAEKRSQDALAQYRMKAAEVRARARAGRRSGPTIEIIRPDVLTTRGPALVPVSAGVAEMEVRGRVTAPAGIRKLTVDNRPLAIDDKGLFRATIAVAADSQEVHLVATDRVGRDGNAVLILQPAGVETLPPSRFRDTNPRMRGDTPVVMTGSYHALIIGVAKYEHFNDLVTAESDAEEIAEILATKFGFQTKILKSPSQFTLLSALRDLKNRLKPEEHLLIYYAGHGKIARSRQRGFWIPADAKKDDEGTWLANEEISDYLDAIPARQILVVSDSCYSGTMSLGLAWVEPRRPAPGGRTGSHAAARRSRKVLTSGGLQPVLDIGGDGHSLFAGALLRVLKLSNEALSGEELHEEVATRVVVKADELGVDQEPQYAPIQHAGHEAGDDFVLTPQVTRRSASR